MELKQVTEQIIGAAMEGHIAAVNIIR